MKRQIFIINGSGGVGKDSFVALMAMNSKCSVGNYSSVTKVKKIAEIIGWNGSKSEKDRKFLSDLKLSKIKQKACSTKTEIEEFLLRFLYSLSIT